MSRSALSAGSGSSRTTSSAAPADSALRDIDGIVVYSHLAGQTAEARLAAGLEGAAELLASLAGTPRYAVNAVVPA